MIYYEDLPLAKEILEALSELQINYVFQPIFFQDGKTIFAREALMRPVGTTVTKLIEEYTLKNQLHVLEVATFWGATQEYYLRGYTEKISINSFPNESFTDSEAKAFIDYYGNEDSVLIIENLEYPEFSYEKSMHKRQIARIGNSMFALDDYGTGINDMDMVDILRPHIIKIDRSHITDIHLDPVKQEFCKDIIKKMHDMNNYVVAEGVETKEEYDYLLTLDIDFFQGYYFAKPM